MKRNFLVILLGLIYVACSGGPTTDQARKTVEGYLPARLLKLTSFETSKPVSEGQNIKLPFKMEIECLQDCSFFIQPGSFDLFIVDEEATKGPVQRHATADMSGHPYDLLGPRLKKGDQMELEGVLVFEKLSNGSWGFSHGFSRSIKPPGFGELP